MGTPNVTIVTPTLNAETYFADTLASIHLQRRQVSIEHIVVDDGSTDATSEMARASGATVVQGSNEGLYAAMNLGLELAQGDVAGVLNADDTLLAGSLPRLMDAMSRSGQPWAVGTLRWVDATGGKIGDLRPPPPWLPAEVLACVGWSYIAHPAAYMERDFIRDLLPFDVRLPVAADYDLLIRARQAAPFAAVTAPTTTFRRHGANASRRTNQLFLDGDEVQRRHGLRHGWGAAIARVSVSAYANLRNPTWALRKRNGYG